MLLRSPNIVYLIRARSTQLYDEGTTCRWQNWAIHTVFKCPNVNCAYACCKRCGVAKEGIGPHGKHVPSPTVPKRSCAPGVPSHKILKNAYFVALTSWIGWERTTIIKTYICRDSVEYGWNNQGAGRQQSNFWRTNSRALYNVLFQKSLWLDAEGRKTKTLPLRGDARGRTP